MPPATSRMFSTRAPQASRVFLRANGRRIAAVSPDTELKASAVQAQPDLDSVVPSLDAQSPSADVFTPAPESPAEPAEAAQASETPSSDSTASAEPAADAEASEPSAEESKPPPEHVSVEDFPYNEGDVVTGRVLFSNARGARIAIHGVKGVLGYLPKNRGPYHLRSAKSVNNYTDGMAPVLPQGTTRRFKILALPPDMAKGGKGPLLVCDQLDQELMWKRLNAVKDLGMTMRETIRVTVTGCVDKGLLINMFGVRGFVPVSHVTKDSDQQWLAKDDLQKFIGREIEVSVMQLNEEKRTFTASMINAVSDRVLRQLRIGSLVWGTVKRLTDYGLFLSLDDTYERALLHITNVSWNRVPSIEDVFSEGDRVRAVVIGMDEGFSRISVSTRDLEENEGDMLSDPQKVYDNAERGVERFLEHVKKWEAEQADGAAE